MDNAMPARSSLPTSADRDSGTHNTVAIKATRATGTLIQKTECQEKCSSSQPPEMGPIAMAKPPWRSRPRWRGRVPFGR